MGSLNLCQKWQVPNGGRFYSGLTVSSLNSFITPFIHSLAVLRADNCSMNQANKAELSQSLRIALSNSLYHSFIKGYELWFSQPILMATADFQNSKGCDAVKRPRRRGESPSHLKTHMEQLSTFIIVLCEPPSIYLRSPGEAHPQLGKNNGFTMINSRCQVETKPSQSCYCQ